MDRVARTTFILISFPKGSRALLDVFSLISKYESLFLGSINVPNPDGKDSILGVLIRADTDQLGAITGTLGLIAGVKIKSAILPDK